MAAKEAQAEAAQAEAAPQGGSGMKTALLVGVVGLVLVAANAGVTLFVNKMVFQQSLSETLAKLEHGGLQAESAPAQPADPPIYVDLDPPITVALERDGSVGYFQVKMDFLVRDPKLEELIRTHTPAIRNALVFLMSNQKYEELRTEEGKERLRRQTLEAVRKVLKKLTGRSDVEDVFFTSLIMQ
ncbi:MAG TPA: flagellar basal body-associated FliL family protein [Chromatiales bacterium]|nr:flagellar basal body-associated FliL family protein [Chromatiales bacterium]